MKSVCLLLIIGVVAVIGLPSQAGRRKRSACMQIQDSDFSKYSACGVDLSSGTTEFKCQHFRRAEACKHHDNQQAIAKLHTLESQANSFCYQSSTTNCPIPTQKIASHYESTGTELCKDTTSGALQLLGMC
nr:protein 21993 [Theama mediterranea]